MAGSSAPPPTSSSARPRPPPAGWAADAGRHRDAAARVHQRGDGVGQHDGGVGQQPAPVARVILRARAQRQLEIHQPREPMNSVGRSACRRGPSLARKTSAASSSRRASQKAARPGEPASSPVSISQTAFSACRRARGDGLSSAARLMLCWPLLSAVPRPYQRSPSTRSVQDRGRRPSAPRCRAPRRRVHTAARWAGPGLRCAAPPGWAGRRWPGCRGCDRQSPGRPAAAPCRRADRRAARRLAGFLALGPNATRRARSAWKVPSSYSATACMRACWRFTMVLVADSRHKVITLLRVPQLDNSHFKHAILAMLGSPP